MGDRCEVICEQFGVECIHGDGLSFREAWRKREERRGNIFSLQIIQSNQDYERGRNKLQKRVLQALDEACACPLLPRGDMAVVISSSSLIGSGGRAGGGGEGGAVPAGRSDPSGSPKRSGKRDREENLHEHLFLGRATYPLARQ